MTGLIRPAAPGPVAVRKQRCENCAFLEDGEIVPGLRGKLCKGGPPTTLLMPGKKPGTMNFHAVWPPVAPTDWCAVWKPKLLGVAQGAGDPSKPQ